MNQSVPHLPSDVRLNIAVVGTGISGMSAAWLLSQRHNVTLYEQDRRLGGHTNTIEATIDGWRARESQVYSKIYHYATPAAKLREDGVIGIILSGGPQSVYSKKAPHPDPAIFELGVPMLGICYGVQLMGYFLGGEVEHSKAREYGHGHLSIKKPGKLFAGLPRKLRIWNSHGDKITKLPPGFRAIGTTENSPFAAVEDEKRRFFGIQFHPEVFHTERGADMIRKRFMLLISKQWNI